MYNLYAIMYFYVFDRLQKVDALQSINFNTIAPHGKQNKNAQNFPAFFLCGKLKQIHFHVNQKEKSIVK